MAAAVSFKKIRQWMFYDNSMYEFNSSKTGFSADFDAFNAIAVVLIYFEKARLRDGKKDG